MHNSELRLHLNGAFFVYSWDRKYISLVGISYFRVSIYIYIYIIYIYTYTCILYMYFDQMPWFTQRTWNIQSGAELPPRLQGQSKEP